MNRKILEERKSKFHIAILKLCEFLLRNSIGFELSKQLIRFAGSVGANYRTSVRAKFKADFIYKIQIVLEEADESHYWLEVIQQAGLVDSPALNELVREANELTAIFAATDKTAKSNTKK